LISEGASANFLTNPVGGGTSAEDREPFFRGALSISEVRSSTGAHCEHGECGNTNETEGKTDLSPAAASGKHLLLVQEESIGLSNDNISGIVGFVGVFVTNEVPCVNPPESVSGHFNY
jgi:hypothetical protein